MSLPPGSWVGIYEVIEVIGVGGMGEVYRARDSRLDRAVAIKTLPEEFAADPDRLARFEREAKLLAQLNHPHIASIYGIEPGPPVALAMEMADGETLAHRIQSGPIALDDALIIARQVAEALEHAHAKGIVHRDLKPANIKIGSPGGDPHVKVLDFGLAKAMMPDSAGLSSSALSSPTITSPANLTGMGVVLGTAAYMAPEQARGRHIDHRVDIWAFGCVLFEMLAGQRPFEGDGVAEVLSKVLQTEPDWSALPAATPESVRRLLLRCLRKDPHRRLHSIADVRIDLEEFASGASDTPAAAAPGRMNVWLPAVAGLAVGAIIATAGVASIYRPSPAAEPSVIRFAVSAPSGWRFTRSLTNGRLQFALSPDGEKLAAVLDGGGNQKIFVRRLTDTTFREVPGTDAATYVLWSPDSRQLAFGTVTGMRVVDLSGGGSRALTTIATLGGAAWSTTDLIAAQAGVGAPLMVWPANSSQPTPVGALPEAVQSRVLPRWLPDGNRLLFADNLGNGAWRLRAHDLSRATVDISQFESQVGGAGLDYQSGQLLLCVTEPLGRSVLTAQSFDATTLRLSGTPVVLATDLNCAFSASGNGRLGFGTNRSWSSRLVWVDSHGAETAITGAPRERTANFDLSHDERFLALQQPGGLIVVHDLARGAASPMPILGTDPTWSPDDREIAYTVTSGAESGIYAIPAFGGQPRLLFKASTPTYIEDWSMDGRWLAAVARSKGQLLPLPAGAPIPLDDASTATDELQFSPDSKWLAYGVINNVGSNEVFLTSVPPTGQRWQISVAGGAAPRWSLDGRSLYYLNAAGALMKVDLNFTPGAAPRISVSRRIVDAVTRVEPTLDQYALSKTGRFIVKKDVEGTPGELDAIQIIVNWPSLLKTAP